jgi:hypothetical protein
VFALENPQGLTADCRRVLRSLRGVASFSSTTRRPFDQVLD